jgi:hypothetical protein
MSNRHANTQHIEKTGRRQNAGFEIPKPASAIRKNAQIS